MVILWQLGVLAYLLVDFTITVMAQCFPDDVIRDVLFDYFDPVMVVVLALDIIITFNICAIRHGEIISTRRGWRGIT